MMCILLDQVMHLKQIRLHQLLHLYWPGSMQHQNGNLTLISVSVQCSLCFSKQCVFEIIFTRMQSPLEQIHFVHGCISRQMIVKEYPTVVNQCDRIVKDLVSDLNVIIYNSI